jgi:hypothetical protein
MRAIIKLLIVALVLHGVYRASVVAVRYYELKDAAQQALIFGGGATTGQLHTQILEEAVALGLPVTAENLEVRRTGQRTVAEARYTQPLEILPNYTYPIDLSFSVDAVAAVPVTAEDGP